MREEDRFRIPRGSERATASGIFLKDMLRAGVMNCCICMDGMELAAGWMRNNSQISNFGISESIRALHVTLTCLVIKETLFPCLKSYGDCIIADRSEPQCRSKALCARMTDCTDS